MRVDDDFEWTCDVGVTVDFEKTLSSELTLTLVAPTIDDHGEIIHCAYEKE